MHTKVLHLSLSSKQKRIWTLKCILERENRIQKQRLGTRLISSQGQCHLYNEPSFPIFFMRVITLTSHIFSSSPMSLLLSPIFEEKTHLPSWNFNKFGFSLLFLFLNCFIESLASTLPTRLQDFLPFLMFYMTSLSFHC